MIPAGSALSGGRFFVARKIFNFPVYIMRDGRIPPTFNPYGGPSIQGPCKIEVLDYDCGGGNVLDTIELSGEKSCAWFLRDDAGAVVVEVHDA